MAIHFSTFNFKLIKHQIIMISLSNILHLQFLKLYIITFYKLNNLLTIISLKKKTT